MKKKIIARILSGFLAVLMVVTILFSALETLAFAAEPNDYWATKEAISKDNDSSNEVDISNSEDIPVESDDVDIPIRLSELQKDSLGEKLDSEEIMEVELVPFVKRGEVITIVNNYNNHFYLKKESFAMDGSYYAPAKETEIAKEDFERYYKTKAFDIADIKVIVRNGTRATFLNVFLNKDGETLDMSYAGNIIDGTFNPITISSTTNKYSWIFDNNGTYYKVVTDPETTESIYTQITKYDYDVMVFNKQYTYSRIVSLQDTSEGNIFNDRAYDRFGNEIGIPTSILVDDKVNIGELFYMINAFNEIHENDKNVLYALDTLTQYLNKNSAPPEDGATSQDGTPYEFDEFLVPAELLEKYSGVYAEWTDDWNQGYMGNWLDPYFRGQKVLVEWDDPFWTQEEIKHVYDGGDISYGYYDDIGNYIKLDSSGSPIPSEQGTFDSAGNFSPEDSSGYYDPSGTYHPLFERIKGLSYDRDNRLHIENMGYFDNNGVWHSRVNNYSEIILYDGRIVFNNGVIYNPVTNQSMPIKTDMWGKYYIGDEEIVYPDYSVFNTITQTLHYANGEEYVAKENDFYWLFDDNSVILKDSFEKGKKESANIALSNGTKVLDSGVFQYPNGVTYNDGSAQLPNGEKVTATFSNSYIDVMSYGRIYENGHVATFNAFNDLITDRDCVILSNGMVLLENGNILDRAGFIVSTYRDGKNNIVSVDGMVIDRELNIGAYDKDGTFIVDSYAEGLSYYDYLGNMVMQDGTVIKEDENYLNVVHRGRYNENGDFVKNAVQNINGYYTADGHLVKPDKTVEKAGARQGFYEKDGYFVMNDNRGYFDTNGTFITGNEIPSYNAGINGLISPIAKSEFILTIDGKITLFGEKGYYDENGIVEVNGKKGYYDENARFVVSTENPYILHGYFYDSKQTKHNAGTIYRDSDGILRLLKNPSIGLDIINGRIKMIQDNLLYDTYGMVIVDGEMGYFNYNGDFIVAKVSPYIGGFYDNTGFWVDMTYYIDPFGNLVVNNGGFNYLGNYITPVGDIGSFDEQGKFKLNVSNRNMSYFYNDIGVAMNFDSMYIDEFGMYKNTNGNEVYDLFGGSILSGKAAGLKMGEYVMVGYGIYMDNDSNLGHFTKDKEFKLGKPPYLNGFYAPDGGFILFGTGNAANQSRNLIFIKNKYYVVNDNGNWVLNTCDGYSFDVRYFSSSYFMLANGITITDSGQVGYFDKDSNFQRGLPESINDVNLSPRQIYETSESSLKDDEQEVSIVNISEEVLNETAPEVFEEEIDSSEISAHNEIDAQGEVQNIQEAQQEIQIDSAETVSQGETSSETTSSTLDYENIVETENSIVSNINNEETTTSELETIELQANQAENEIHEDDTEVATNSSSEETTSVEEEVIETNIVAGKSFKTLDGKYIELADDSGYYLIDGTFMQYNGTYGFFDMSGEFHSNVINPYMNGFYNRSKEWIPFSMSATPPNEGYFNRFGVQRNGSNPHNNGFYDYEGSWHPFNGDYFIDMSGNVIRTGVAAIGYKDVSGRFFEYGLDGYYDVDGTYYIGLEMIGYYNKDTELIVGKNPSFEGFYDSKGNWHLFGDVGYYTPKGDYIESVTDEVIGYFNEVGEFTVGFNPYINGYHDFNGNWNDIDSKPLTFYFNSEGTKIVGSNSNSNGFYDMFANWHPIYDNGYFDIHGTYYSVVNDSIGYFDNRGNYREGTNPYQHGYYDSDGNLRLFEHPNYFNKNGTYVDENNALWYFTKDKLKKKGQNVYVDGFYDMFANWYPFNESGYYTEEGLFFPTLLIVDKYKVGSPNYILFEGIFKNPDFIPYGTKNTLQFTLSNNTNSPIYVDTGIRVSKNAMISYANARDLVHNISIHSKSIFIEDNNSCLVIIDGKIINLTDNGKMSIKELRDKFVDSNIEIVVAKTRIGERYTLVDNIEIGRDISVLMEENSHKLSNPMIVRDSTPYISLKDISELISYDVKSTMTNSNRIITFTLKDDIKAGMIREYLCIIDNPRAMVTLNNDQYVYYSLKAPIIETMVSNSMSSEIYVPVYMLSDLSGKFVEFNTYNATIVITDANNQLPMTDN